MEKNCEACGASRFRLSRFRFSDVLPLLVFRYPVRCLKCSERTYASLPWVLEYRRMRAKRK